MSLVIEELLELLPEGLGERVRLLSSNTVHSSGEFVLYWMCTAVRADENPALEVAITAANELGLPVLVYQALSDRHPYAADRHHTFYLEGARDVQLALAERDIAYAFHLERPGHRGSHLQALAARTALVVTEDMPVQPLRAWTRLLSSSVDAPVLKVDTACIVPMQLVGQAYERAFAYRKATKQFYEQRIKKQLEPIVPAHTSELPDDLPFEPIDLQTANLGSLVAQCEIDHTVGPVPHTVGGSVAGSARWLNFKNTKLSGYAKLRNNPLAEGVSWLSAYLHYGMVSPQRIARESAEIRNEGAEKYLDELLIWRELAYSFCFYREDHDSLSALSEWAIKSLAEHESDRRPALLSWEALARGRTQDILWDAAQASLLIHGQLHNNVRMTWGKAIVNWTKDAQQALAMMIDLNHRYALDGGDPASYGGILWCLGQFDRPFQPARPIFGPVRDRSTAQHSQRLNSQKYLSHTTRPLCDPSLKVAVIGAGISGLVCARTLQDHGINVTVYEKSRGPGGRMSTRRTEEGLQFDHGAQYFTARDPRFRRYVDSWQHDGIVAPWNGRIVTLQGGEVIDEKGGSDRFVAVPGMNAICRHLASDLDIHYGTKVSPLQESGDSWQLADDDSNALGAFDAVIVSAPAFQTAVQLTVVPDLAAKARSSEMSGCWAVMVALRQGLELPFCGAFVHESPLSWIALDSSKPGRSSQSETWILHASPDWSEANMERQPADVEAELLAEFWRSIGKPAVEINYSTAHRWRFALPTSPLESRCLFDGESMVGACGDWCGGPRVEGAFLSGSAVAGRVLGEFMQMNSALQSASQYQPQLS
ncbi:MAG: FAD-dependent oxidoreductase [Pirellulales bacterium]|nr:FAD-dependent oxidoreductase [Pirellulales bacterium]